MAPTPPIPHQDDAEAQPPGGRPEQEYPRAERYRAVNRPLNFRQSAIQIEREVGRGGNAVVHRVTIVGRHPGLAVNEAALKTFVSGSVDEVCHEVDVHLQLADHLVAAKYIPAIYGVAVDDSDRPLGIVMELVQGQTLEAYFADRQPSRSPLDMLREVLRIGIEATEGIIAINGVATHKDLSPRNILVRTTQHGVQVVIVDFGSAHIHDTADLGPRPRTVRYAASEIKDNQPGSRTSDVYSLAAVLKDLFVLPMAALAEAPEYKTAVQLLRTQFADFLAEDQKQRRDGLELLEVLRSAEANLRPRRIRSRRVRVGVMLGANAAVLGCIFFFVANHTGEPVAARPGEKPVHAADVPTGEVPVHMPTVVVPQPQRPDPEVIARPLGRPYIGIDSFVWALDKLDRMVKPSVDVPKDPIVVPEKKQVARSSACLPEDIGWTASARKRCLKN